MYPDQPVRLHSDVFTQRTSGAMLSIAFLLGCMLSTVAAAQTQHPGDKTSAAQKTVEKTAPTGRDKTASSATKADTASVDDAEPAQTRALFSRPRVDEGHLPYVELGKNVGHRYRVYMKERPPIVLEVSHVEKGTVYVRRKVAGGSASYPLDKTTFSYAELID